MKSPVHLRFLAAAIGAIAILGIAGCVSQSSRADDSRSSVKPAGVRKPAPDFEAKDANGQAFHLSDYKGKVVFVNFWATWCGPCKIEIPWFKEFERTYKSKGFAVIGVSLDEDGWEAVKPYIEERQLNYRVALGSPKIEELFAGSTGIESLPTTFVIDRAGKVASVHLGLISKSDYQNEIEELLQ